MISKPETVCSNFSRTTVITVSDRIRSMTFSPGWTKIQPFRLLGSRVNALAVLSFNLTNSLVKLTELCPLNRKCGSRRHLHCSFSALYLLNQWVDFDQTCTDTLFGGRKEVIWFWRPWPHVQGHSTEIFKFWPKKKLVCTHPRPISWTVMTDSGQTSYIATGWFKDLIRF